MIFDEKTGRPGRGPVRGAAGGFRLNIDIAFTIRTDRALLARR
jgi:hypothetical protein